MHVLHIADDLLDLLDAGLQVYLLHGDVVRVLHLGDVDSPGLQDADGVLQAGLGLGQLAVVGLGQAQLVVERGNRPGWRGVRKTRRTIRKDSQEDTASCYLESAASSDFLISREALKSSTARP